MTTLFNVLLKASIIKCELDINLCYKIISIYKLTRSIDRDRFFMHKKNLYEDRITDIYNSACCSYKILFKSLNLSITELKLNSDYVTGISVADLTDCVESE